MRTRRVLGFAFAVFLLVSASGITDPPSETFLLFMPTPNMGEAPNGDKVAVFGQGTFSLHPKSVTTNGTFIHTDFMGNVLGGGTWVASQLLEYQSYGCGVLAFTDPPAPIPSNFCGGALKMRVELTAGPFEFDGIADSTTTHLARGLSAAEIDRLPATRALVREEQTTIIEGEETVATTRITTKD